MSDDDRMDRARRIRKMREGRRVSPEESNGESPAGEDDEGGADGGGGDTTESDDGNSESAAAKAVAAAAEFESVDAAGEPDTPLQQFESEAHERDAETVEDGDTEDSDEEPAGAAATSRAAEAESKDEEETRVLEFELGDERYCLNIMSVEEIIKNGHITRVPNTPEFVRGVVDLRGQITTILDPKEFIGVGAEGEEELIIVFDGDTFEDQGYIGWLVDDVRQVTPIVPSEVKELPIDRKHVNGVIERDDEFVIWTDPETALAEADTDDES